MRTIRLGAIALLAVLAGGSRVNAQISVPVKSYEHLSLEVQTLRDNVTLFRGDPQYLLHMEVRPNRFRPQVDYFDQSDATLKIRDLYAIDHPDFRSQSPADRDKAGDAPLAEEWEIRLSPVAPTSFSLQCERGEATLDFTDFEVQRVEMRADETKVNVEFDHPNSIELERFAARVIAGTLHFQKMINARAKEISIDVPNTACRLEITGKEFAGETAINVLSVPSQMQLLVSRKVGLRVTGPAATIAGFKAAHMSATGEEWMSQGYAEAKCRVHLTFGSEVPKLTVAWK